MIPLLVLVVGFLALLSVNSPEARAESFPSSVLKTITILVLVLGALAGYVQ
jgi:hypothetical protein